MMNASENSMDSAPRDKLAETVAKMNALHSDIQDTRIALSRVENGIWLVADELATTLREYADGLAILTAWADEHPQRIASLNDTLDAIGPRTDYRDDHAAAVQAIKDLLPEVDVERQESPDGYNAVLRGVPFEP